jgi:hypothetical protein
MESALPRHHILRQNGGRRFPGDVDLPKSLVLPRAIGERSKTLAKSKSSSEGEGNRPARSLSRSKDDAKNVSPSKIGNCVSLDTFKLLFPVGVGTFGKVWKATHLASGAYYAIKKLSKLQIIRKGAIQLVCLEKRLLELLKNR